jgi:integrase
VEIPTPESKKTIMKVNDLLWDGFHLQLRSHKTDTPPYYFQPKIKSVDFKGNIYYKVIMRLLELSELQYPEISFAICLQAFCGLKPGEVCNVRQANCPNGGGYTYAMDEGKWSRFTINLINPSPLRTDGVNVGVVKNKRVQVAYKEFLPELEYYHNFHIERLKSENIEEGRYPLFVYGHGKALTVESYRKRFNKLVSCLLEDLLQSKELELFNLLKEKKLTPSALRKWFTFQLLINGETLNNIANYRGDKNLDAVLSLINVISHFPYC